MRRANSTQLPNLRVNLVHLRSLKICLIAITLTACQSNPTKFKLKDELHFVSESSDHKCQQLVIGKNQLGWVNNATSTNLGVVAQPCVTDQSSDLAKSGGDLALGIGDRLGYVQNWTLFPWNHGPAKQLQIADLSGFSSPSFCGDYVAFWAIADQAGQSLVMRISSLATGKTEREIIAQSVMIATDDAGYLAYPKWGTSCLSVIFLDPKSAKETVLTIAH